MDGSTALAVLGLAPGATKQQVKTAFRTLVKEVHPDASGDASSDQARFHRLHAAYEQALADAPVDVTPSPRPASTTAASTTAAWISTATTGSSSTIDITDVLLGAYAQTRPTTLTGSVGSRRTGAEGEFAALLDAELARA